MDFTSRILQLPSWSLSTNCTDDHIPYNISGWYLSSASPQLRRNILFFFGFSELAELNLHCIQWPNEKSIITKIKVVRSSVNKRVLRSKKGRFSLYYIVNEYRRISHCSDEIKVNNGFQFDVRHLTMADHPAKDSIIISGTFICIFQNNHTSWLLRSAADRTENNIESYRVPFQFVAPSFDRIAEWKFYCTFSFPITIAVSFSISVCRQPEHRSSYTTTE